MRRLKCGKAAWHVYARGARRLVLFRDDQDFQRFLSILAYGLRISGAALWAFVLMSNHYHLALYGTSDEITACMKRVNQMYSIYHNRKYRLGGHTFDGPYERVRQGWIGLLMRTIAYIAANPVVAGMVDRPEDYRWSSYLNYLGASGTPLDVDATSPLGYLGASSLDARRMFERALKYELAQPKNLKRLVPTAVEIQAEHFVWLKTLAVEQAGSLGGEDPELVAMYRARQAGIPPRAIARGLNLPSSAQLRHRIAKFTERLERCPEIKAIITLS